MYIRTPFLYLISPPPAPLWHALAPLYASHPLPLQTGCTPLHYAAIKGSLESVRLLIDRGADKGAKTKVRK